MMYKIAVIDDEEFWLNRTGELLKPHEVHKFYDWNCFCETYDFNYFDAIIVDYRFKDYNIEDTDIKGILKRKKFKKNITLITHIPNNVKDRNVFSKIISKKSLTLEGYSLIKNIFN